MMSLPIPLLRNGVLSHDSFRHLVRYKKAAETGFYQPIFAAPFFRSQEKACLLPPGLFTEQKQP